MRSPRRTAGLLAAVCALSFAAAQPAAAASGPHSCGESRSDRAAASLDPTTPLVEIELLDKAVARACGHDGVHADAAAPDLLCVHVEALTSRELADARARIPCPPRWDGFRDCEQAHAAGVYDIPEGDKRYRGVLDRDNDGVACESSDGDIEGAKPGDAEHAPVAGAPETIIHDLPVTH